MMRSKEHFESPLFSAILKVLQRKRGDFPYAFYIRVGAEEQGGGSVWPCSNLFRYTVGQALSVDGGLYIK